MSNRLEVQNYLGIPYKYKHGPKEVRSREQGFHAGINCIVLAHWILEDNGIKLPEEMLSKEIYEDENEFRVVGEAEEFKPGDVFIFSKKEELDLYNLHLAIYTGEINEQEEPLLIHANYVDKGVSVWSLEKFLNNKRYGRLCAVKRYRQV